MIKVFVFSVKPASLVAQTVKYLPTMWETQDQSLGWEDPLEKGMATHSSFIAWKIPWTEEPGGLQSTALKESDMTNTLNLVSLLAQMVKNLPAMWATWV